MIHLTRSQVREIDRLAMEKYGLPGIVLMENAARAASDAAWEMLGHKGGRVIVYCGTGNNGGDGYAMARHLHNRSCAVTCVGDADRLKGDALTNYTIARAMHLAGPGAPAVSIDDCDLIVDALFGTGLNQPPRGHFAEMIEAINRSGRPVLAIDLPSGLDCDTGQPLGACVKATRTITFVAAKIGFAHPESRQYTGEVSVGDIGCPRELIDEVRR